MIGLALTLAVLPSAQAVGPSRAELQQVLQDRGYNLEARNLTALECHGFGDDEPTEFSCSWTAGSPDETRRYETTLAISGLGWQLIDGVAALEAQ
ncbi:hypothetical protein VCJ71_06725 [Alteriqipengyuania sp. WL0013]|uniref:hypothetical protein n=1 Tax=Alteriqipengyuania sp. WL0013 TaxID=3110773 RepID=UPI002BC28513|nr:hypothetical protein [Alteriqipengyuania sp. WL0013]MEB3415755.1 hypothetical protein [Alteriqipengyuania sp. WL0013]